MRVREHAHVLERLERRRPVRSGVTVGVVDVEVRESLRVQRLDGLRGGLRRASAKRLDVHCDVEALRARRGGDERQAQILG